MIAQQQPQREIELLNQMIDTIKRLETLSFTLSTEERIEGEMNKTYSEGKVLFEPYSCYFHANKTGAEILYKTGENENKALIAPHSFPYFNLSLDPYSYFMRNKRHHTILHGGFRYFAEVMNQLIHNENTVANTSFLLRDRVDTLGKTLHVISLAFTDFNWQEYTITTERSLTELATKKNLHDYMILERNSTLDDFEDIETGDNILIPTRYCHRIELWLDPNHRLPWLTKIYDDKGLWSSYLYHDLMLNPTFEELDFSADNPNYGF